MKERFLDALTYNLIDKYNFMPLAAETGELLIHSPLRMLESSSFGGLTLVEIIDGDTVGAEYIKGRLAANAERLGSIKGREPFYLLEILVFNDKPDIEVLNAVSAGQYNKEWDKRYLSCFTVGITDKQVESFDPGKTGKVVSMAIDEALSADKETVDTDYNVQALVESKQKEYSLEFVSKVPFWTYALIAANIAVWLLIHAVSLSKGVDYNLLLNTFGAKNNLNIMQGEYWRLLTPVFLHGNIVHLAINCYSLYQVGVITERIFGNVKFVFIYFVAGILGNIASFMFSPYYGVGASGAIFGLMGALLYFGIENPKQFKRFFGYNIALMIFINISYGFSHAGIDNFAHIGGLIGGFLASGIVQLRGAVNKFLRRPVFLAATLIITVLSLYYGFTCSQNVVVVKVESLEKLSKAQNWSGAEKLGTEILAKNPKDGNIRLRTLWALVVADASQGKYDKAFEYTDSMKKVDEARGCYLKGALYLDTRQYALAKQELQRAKELDTELKEAADELLKDIANITQ